jgi:hypothetical protein
MEVTPVLSGTGMLLLVVPPVLNGIRTLLVVGAVLNGIDTDELELDNSELVDGSTVVLLGVVIGRDDEYVVLGKLGNDVVSGGGTPHLLSPPLFSMFASGDATATAAKAASREMNCLTILLMFSRSSHK